MVLQRALQGALDWICRDPVWFRRGDVIVVKFGAIAGAATAGGLLSAALMLQSVEVPASFVRTWMVAATVALLLCSIVAGKVLDALRSLGDGRRHAGRISFTFLGGFLGVTLATAALAQHHGIPFARCTDAMLVTTPCFHALSRLACLNYGCCFGREQRHAGRLHTTYTHPASKPVRTLGLSGVPLHPVPLYELAGNLALGVVLLALWSGVGLQGLVSAVYLVGYAALRYLADRYRHETHHHHGISYRYYQGALTVGFVLGGIGFAGTAGLEAVPLRPAFELAHLAGLLSVAPLVLVLALAVALAYGVHRGQVGQWFADDPTPPPIRDPEEIHRCADTSGT